jgi:hypothetical protein
VTRESSLKSCEDTRASILVHELAANAREGALETWDVEVAGRERLLAEQQMQELAAAQKWLEDLKAIRVGEAQKVWEFLGQAEFALVPFGFSPLWSEVPAREVSAELPLLEFAGTKMSQLEDVIASRLKAEGGGGCGVHIVMPPQLRPLGFPRASGAGTC